ncbi:MAG: MBL fold metallo-hydrolase [Deltaproteobacteria bacterium]|nr:MBL fold metallo-hydrolase [Deltaproteobacteria bacterium]
MAFVVLAAAVSVTAGACGLAAPGYRGPASSNFDGRVFENQVVVPQKNLYDVVRWKLASNAEPWKAHAEESAPGAVPQARVAQGALHVTMVNHATVLIQMDGINILTDPIWSDRASPFSFVGPRRHHAPGLRFEDLPPIDVVLISHNHYDHLDVPTLQRLAQAHRPLFLAGLGTRALLAEKSIDCGVDMDWWDSFRVGNDMFVTAVPAQHWSRRGIGDTNNTLWMGFVIEGQRGPVYFAGDTGWGPHFEQIRDRFGPMRLALLPIGAYMPRWFMHPMHISPEEAVDAARVLDAQVTVPVHWGTFQLGDEGRDEPLRALERYQSIIVDPPEFLLLHFGEGKAIEALERPLNFAGPPSCKPRQIERLPRACRPRIRVSAAKTEAPAIARRPIKRVPCVSVVEFAL